MGKDSGRLDNRLRELRQQAGGLTQQELAERVGITRQTVIAIEGNRYSPSLKVAFLIANALGVGIEQVFQFSADP